MERRNNDEQRSLEDWKPKSRLGKEIFSGKKITIDEIFEKGIEIVEPQIVDMLLPDIKSEIIMIGGSSGKGGGSRRTPFRRTARMHKSGRRYRISVITVVGNENGYVGIGLVRGPIGKNREVLDKSLNKAKLNIIPIRRGCGSWECRCRGNHSIPFTVTAKVGSVRVKLMPAPKGLGLCVSDEVKKVLRLAGIKDIWCKVRGKSQTRVNLIKAVFEALRKTNKYKLLSEYVKRTGLVTGIGDR